MPTEDYAYVGTGNDPGDGSWRGVIMPYCKNAQLFFCPSKKPAAPLFDGRYNDDGLNAGYAINDCHQDSGIPTPPEAQSLGACEDAASVIFLVESDGNEDDIGLTNLNTHEVPTVSSLQRHNGGSNYAFVDGHAKWLKPTVVCTGSDCLFSCEADN